MVAKLRDPSNRPLLIVAVCAAVLLVGCYCSAVVATVAGAVLVGDSGGMCVVDSPTGRAGWAHCYDDWTERECDDLSDTTYYSGRSCNALGFTKQCPGEAPAWRMPAYPCD